MAQKKKPDPYQEFRLRLVSFIREGHVKQILAETSGRASLIRRVADLTMMEQGDLGAALPMLANEVAHLNEMLNSLMHVMVSRKLMKGDKK